MQQNFTMNGLQTLLYFPFKDSNSRTRLLIASAIGLAGFIIPIYSLVVPSRICWVYYETDHY